MSKLLLFFRHYGRHDLLKETVVEPSFADLVKDGKVDEDLVVASMPPDFLPVAPEKCLLVVQDESGRSGTGQRPTTRFRSWAKYFDSYSLEICR